MALFYRPLSEAEKEALQTEIEFIYSTFVSHVAEGRKMKYESVDSIGQGRIWSGLSASRLGLVDELGGLEKALQLAAGQANLSEYRVVNLPELEDPLTQLMKMLSENTSAKVLEKTLGDSWPFFRDLNQILSMQGVLPVPPTVILPTPIKGMSNSTERKISMSYRKFRILTTRPYIRAKGRRYFLRCRSMGRGVFQVTIRYEWRAIADVLANAYQ